MTTEELRVALAQAERKGVGRPYPEELRKAVAAHVMARHDEGENLTSLAEALGLSLITVQRWAKQENVAIFRPVSVVEGRIEGRGRVVVHGPRGVRIEGLDAAGLAELLRRLG